MEREVDSKTIYNSFAKRGIPANFCDCLTGMKLSVDKLKEKSGRARVAGFQEITLTASGVLSDCRDMPMGKEEVENALLEVLTDLKDVYTSKQTNSRF